MGATESVLSFHEGDWLWDDQDCNLAATSREKWDEKEMCGGCGCSAAATELFGWSLLTLHRAKETQAVAIIKM